MLSEPKLLHHVVRIHHFLLLELTGDEKLQGAGSGTVSER